MIWIAPEKLFKKEAEMGSFQNGIKPQKNKKKKNKGGNGGGKKSLLKAKIMLF